MILCFIGQVSSIIYNDERKIGDFSALNDHDSDVFREFSQRDLSLKMANIKFIACEAMISVERSSFQLGNSMTLIEFDAHHVGHSKVSSKISRRTLCSDSACD